MYHSFEMGNVTMEAITEATILLAKHWLSHCSPFKIVSIGTQSSNILEWPDKSLPV